MIVRPRDQELANLGSEARVRIKMSSSRIRDGGTHSKIGLGRGRNFSPTSHLSWCSLNLL